MWLRSGITAAPQSFLVRNSLLRQGFWRRKSAPDSRSLEDWDSHCQPRHRGGRDGPSSAHLHTHSPYSTELPAPAFPRELRLFPVWEREGWLRGLLWGHQPLFRGAVFAGCAFLASSARAPMCAQEAKPTPIQRETTDEPRWTQILRADMRFYLGRPWGSLSDERSPELQKRLSERSVSVSIWVHLWLN